MFHSSKRFLFLLCFSISSSCWGEGEILGPIIRTVHELEAIALPPKQNSAMKKKRAYSHLLQKEGDGMQTNFFPQDRSSMSFQEGSLSPLAATLNFTAVTESDTGQVPPSPVGAVGMTQYIVCCNGRIRSFDKTTGERDGVLDMSTDQFFAPFVSSIYFTTDSRIHYDRPTDTWFVIMLVQTFWSLQDRLCIAVAKGNITKETKWSLYSFWPHEIEPRRDFQVQTDSPTFGIDQHALYIGTLLLNDFGIVNSDAFVIPKKPLLDGTLHVTVFRDLIDPITRVGPFAPQGVINFDADATEGYFIGVDATNCGRLMLRKVKDPGSLQPQLSNNISISVLSTTTPLSVPHKGNTLGIAGYLQGVDDWLCKAHIRDKHLYTAHNVGTNAKGTSSGLQIMTANGCRWYEIDLTDSNHPTLVQAGTLYDSSPKGLSRRHFWIPSLMTNDAKTILLGCSTAGMAQFADAAYAMRYATDPAGQLRTPVLYTSSQSAYDISWDPGGPLGRLWGNYSDVSLDPSDNLTLWAIQEFCNAPDSFGCQVIAIPAAPPPDIASISPDRIAPNLSAVEISIGGVAQAGAAYYNPPPDCPKHLSIEMDDLEVLSYTVTAADEIKVLVSTLGATKGMKSIRVRNPDGQEKITSNMLVVE